MANTLSAPFMPAFLFIGLGCPARSMAAGPRSRRAPVLTQAENIINATGATRRKSNLRAMNGIVPDCSKMTSPASRLRRAARRRLPPALSTETVDKAGAFHPGSRSIGTPGGICASGRVRCAAARNASCATRHSAAAPTARSPCPGSVRLAAQQFHGVVRGAQLVGHGVDLHRLFAVEGRAVLFGEGGGVQIAAFMITR